MKALLNNNLNASVSDYLNTGTLVLSFILACILPFDLILLSYAFLGPAHYLTQISWMQKKSFFIGSKAFPWIAVLLSASFVIVYLFFIEDVAFGMVGGEGFSYYNNVFGYILYTSFMVALIGLLQESWTKKIIYFLGAQLLFLLLHFQWQELIIALALFIPTVIHVYVFTWAFMLHGALNTNSLVGYFNCFLMIFLGLLIMLILPDRIHYDDMIFKDMINNNIGYFSPASEYIRKAFSGFGEIGSAAALGFLSFAFTFHYLNWFSKINVIRWHDISRRRTIIIVSLYLLSIALFLYKYYIGLLALIFLSIYHIITEFPLNIITFKSLFSRLKFTKTA